jgi:hypothetical protein
MKNIIKKVLSCVMFVVILSACGNTDVADVVTEEFATTTQQTEITTTTTTAETTIQTTTAETEPPETEPTTTASITTADNSSDTRTTQQKLDDVIAANPDVEIGYALYNADTNQYLYHYNDEMEIDVSGEVPIYWLYRILDRNELEEKVLANFEVTTYENSYIVELYLQEEWWFKVVDLINYYFYEQDAGAKATLERRVPLGYSNYIDVNGETIRITEKDGTERSSITQYIAKWLFVNEFLSENSEESEFLKELLTNSDRDSYFYEGTGIMPVHVGDEINSQCYDTGVVTANGTDYIYVIYTKDASSQDIVKDISRILYESI